MNFFYSTKINPILKFNRHDFSFTLALEVFFSGFWNVISRIGLILPNSIDLLIVNYFFNSIIIGYIAVS